MSEEFVPVVGWEKFEVSKNGVVRNKTTKRQLTATISAWGYPLVALTMQGRATTKNLSRVLAEAFLGLLPGSELEVVHIDSNKLNCALNNLRVDSKQQQMKNAYKTGSKKASARSGINKVCVNIYLVETGEWLCTCWSTQAAARLTGLSQAQVSLAINGKYKQEGKFRFERA